MPTGTLRDAKATPGWWQQAGCLGLYLLRTCGEEGGGVFSLFGSPGLGPLTVATLSIQSVPQAWQPPGDPATWVRPCPPGSQAGRATPVGGVHCRKAGAFPAPPRPGAWNSASALYLSRKGLEPTRSKAIAPSSFFPEPTSVPG